MRDARARLTLPALACITLGLAPLAPEPHVVEKVRWVVRGGEGMAAIDLFDLVLHGAPWVWFAVVLAGIARGRGVQPAAEAGATDA